MKIKIIYGGNYNYNLFKYEDFEKIKKNEIFDLAKIKLVYFNNEYKKFIADDDDKFVEKNNNSSKKISLKLKNYKSKEDFGWINGEDYKQNEENEEKKNIIPIVFANIFISLKLKDNPFINYKQIIKNYNGKFLDDLHLTLGRYKLSYKDQNQLRIFLENIIKKKMI